MEPLSQKPSYFSAVILPVAYSFFLIVLTMTLTQIDLPLVAYVKANSLQSAPLGPSPEGQVGFAAVYLIIAIIVTVTLAAVVVRKRLKPSRWVIGAFGFLILCSLIVPGILYWLPFPQILVLPAGLWLLYVFAIKGKLPEYMMIPFISLMAICAGIGFSIFLPTITVIAMLMAFSCWDLFAVLKSKVMIRLATNLPDKLRALFMVKLGARYLGMGDLLFYAVLVALATTYGTVAAAFTGGLMIGGIFFTFDILNKGKFKALPGLPIPLALGLFGLLLSQLV